MKRSNQIFLNDIHEAVSDIEIFSKGLTFKDFKKNKRDRYAIFKCFEIIGEATKHLEENFKSSYPRIPWKRIASFRDVLTHEYFEIEEALVWRIIKKRLPVFKKDINKIIETEKR